MTQQHLHSRAAGKSEEIMLCEFSIVIAAKVNNPAILNPDFLQHNEIVDEQYEVVDSPITTPAFSQVKFNNGISVTSTPEQVVFQQSKDRLNVNAIYSPSIAKRYIECVPHVNYAAVGINPTGFSPNQSKSHVLNMLREGGSWIRFKDTSPAVALNTTYDFGNKKIFLEISRLDHVTDNENISGTVFRANFHHQITDQNAASRTRILPSILESWKHDLDDFFDLVAKYS